MSEATHQKLHRFFPAVRIFPNTNFFHLISRINSRSRCVKGKNCIFQKTAWKWKFFSPRSSMHLQNVRHKKRLELCPFPPPHTMHSTSSRADYFSILFFIRTEHKFISSSPLNFPPAVLGQKMGNSAFFIFSASQLHSRVSTLVSIRMIVSRKNLRCLLWNFSEFHPVAVHFYLSLL